MHTVHKAWRDLRGRMRRKEKIQLVPYQSVFTERGHLMGLLFTINKEKCTDECGMHGEKYFWYHTSKADADKWDYCSPPGLVKPVQFTTKGGHCISECRQEEKNCHWCDKNLDYCTDGSKSIKLKSN